MIISFVFLLFFSFSDCQWNTTGVGGTPSYFRIVREDSECLWLYNRSSVSGVMKLLNLDAIYQPNLVVAIKTPILFTIIEERGNEGDQQTFYQVSYGKEYYFLTRQLIETDPLIDIYRYPLADFYKENYWQFTVEEFAICTRMGYFSDPSSENELSFNIERATYFRNLFEAAILEQEINSVVHSIYIATLIGLYTNGFRNFEWNTTFLNTSECNPNYPLADDIYYGRGMIPLIGKCLYDEAGRDLHVVNSTFNVSINPSMASHPEVAFRLAVWLYKKTGANLIAQNDTDFLSESLDPSSIETLMDLFDFQNINTSSSGSVDFVEAIMAERVYGKAKDWLQICFYKRALPFDPITLLFIIKIICDPWEMGCYP